MKIIQITSHKDELVGLADDGRLYVLVGSLRGTCHWEPVKPSNI